MTDKVMDQVARLCGRTHVWLGQVAERLIEAGLPDWAQAAQGLAKEHGDFAISCYEDTLPTLVARIPEPEDDHWADTPKGYGPEGTIVDDDALDP